MKILLWGGWIVVILVCTGYCFIPLYSIYLGWTIKSIGILVTVFVLLKKFKFVKKFDAFATGLVLMVIPIITTYLGLSKNRKGLKTSV